MPLHDHAVERGAGRHSMQRTRPGSPRPARRRPCRSRRPRSRRAPRSASALHGRRTSARLRCRPRPAAGGRGCWWSSPASSPPRGVHHIPHAPWVSVRCGRPPGLGSARPRRPRCALASPCAPSLGSWRRRPAPTAGFQAWCPGSSRGRARAGPLQSPPVQIVLVHGDPVSRQRASLQRVLDGHGAELVLRKVRVAHRRPQKPAMKMTLQLASGARVRLAYGIRSWRSR